MAAKKLREFTDAELRWLDQAKKLPSISSTCPMTGTTMISSKKNFTFIFRDDGEGIGTYTHNFIAYFGRKPSRKPDDVVWIVPEQIDAQKIMRQIILRYRSDDSHTSIVTVSEDALREHINTIKNLRE